MTTRTRTLTSPDGFDVAVEIMTCDRCDCDGVCVDCDYDRTITQTVTVETGDPDAPFRDEEVTVELPDDLTPLMAGATGGYAMDRVYCAYCADEVGEEIERREEAEAALKRVAEAADLGDADADALCDALATMDDAHPEGFAGAAAEITTLLPRDLRARSGDPETIAETQVVAVLPAGAEVTWCGARKGRDAWGVRAPDEARSALGRQRYADATMTTPTTPTTATGAILAEVADTPYALYELLDAVRRLDLPVGDEDTRTYGGGGWYADGRPYPTEAYDMRPAALALGVARQARRLVRGEGAAGAAGR